jgi:hypothetical protein
MKRIPNILKQKSILKQMKRIPIILKQKRTIGRRADEGKNLVTCGDPYFKLKNLNA